ncbi:NADH-quinone oxidoreductase subunit A [Pseudonocardia halophobica]|uniref:NADH-quinone oxidoreductase subunit n=1 Tax=Pseudonocardia halophobica TaxID=29401 RepID=A0A9W6KXB0_9PSEU|nr:NADH-quinone oxidoreductase subunit A [Pseudonocardia halophobica]GLL09413.1 NADH-quinone oxidoreductase subunit A 1 [Pseudonocardia halophobica]
MSQFWPVLITLGVALVLVAALYVLSAITATARTSSELVPFAGGVPPTHHAFSRFHVRWYPVTMVFLAFDMEMIFMYPWTLVVSRVGPSAVIEMFLFLGILLAGVVYAWREGALRWT